MSQFQKNIQISGQYVVIPLTLDIPDWGKYTVIAAHKVIPYTLWVSHSASAGEATDYRDVSKAASLGIYISVNGATTITTQVLTQMGWDDFDSTIFTSAGYIFYNIWILPFSQIRFTTSNSIVASIQLFIRT